MATITMVAMITSPTVLPIWKRHAAFFRGADELLAWLAKRPAMERRCIERAAHAQGADCLNGRPKDLSESVLAKSASRNI